MSNPVVIGVTGGIGAGKSTAVRAFVRRGAVAFSADDAVHRLYASDDVRDAVVARWGDRVLAPDGSVDRPAVAAIVFNDDDELSWLEGLLHPLVAREWLRFLHEQRERDDAPAIIVAEVPLLFEAGLADRYDTTVLITAPSDERLERVGERAQGDSHGEQRVANQMPEHEKEQLADFVFHNTGSIDDIQSFVDTVINQVQVPS